MLRIELAALNEEDFDLSLVGFDTHELDELLLGDAVEDSEDIVPEPPENPVTVHAVGLRMPPESMNETTQVRAFSTPPS